jgi:hypothetical protein
MNVSEEGVLAVIKTVNHVGKIDPGLGIIDTIAGVLWRCTRSRTAAWTSTLSATWTSTLSATWTSTLSATWASTLTATLAPGASRWTFPANHGDLLL